ncbi:TetR-like C-terminal domain-containing protein [Bacillota bacterium Meth-B3]|nr:TetR/AcrR family transcriptional regulator [Christensenellaceae bacterium]
MEGKQDRRIRKTRTLLRKGLAELMCKKRVQDITVREIAELCDINRSTFYLHYKDVFDMVEQIENELLGEFQEIMECCTPEQIENNPRAPLTKLFSFLHDNADITQAFIGPNGDLAFVNLLKNEVSERCVNIWRDRQMARNTEHLPYYAAYVVSGCVGLLEAWFKGGLAESAEEIAVFAEDAICSTIGVQPRKAAP